MKAIVCGASPAGEGPSFAEVAEPKPRRGEVLVRVKAVSLNAGDWRALRMGIRPKSGIIGSDLAGVVETAGPDAKALRPGDGVVGDLSACGCGALADFVSVPERALARKPENISFEEAASCPVAGVAALQALRDKGRVRSGESALIVGASGGVGTFAVQLAKRFGARVTAVCGSGNVDLARSLGADRVIDRRKTGVAEWGGPYDLALAIHGNEGFGQYRKLLCRDGRLVLVGGSLPHMVAYLLLGPFLSLGRRKTRTLVSVPDAGDLAFVLRFVSQGSVKPAIEAVYGFADAPAAITRSRAGHPWGKIIVRMG
jgi:NADPH:quinone reductase-like Zn-dependent oxidoreductase